MSYRRHTDMHPKNMETNRAHPSTSCACSTHILSSLCCSYACVCNDDTIVSNQSAVLNERKDEARRTQPCGVKYYVGLILVIRFVVIGLSISYGRFALQYLTYQVYLLTTLFYSSLLLYLCGVRKLYLFTFHILFPLVYGLLFASVILLWILVYRNSELIADAVEEEGVTLGQLYVIDHSLHTIPFVNIVIIAFMFGRYTLLTPYQLRKRQKRTQYYDMTSTERYESTMALHTRTFVERVAHLSRCQKLYYTAYVFHYVLASSLYIFAYMSIFEFERIYGQVSLHEPIIDLLILGLCLLATATLVLISVYTIQNARRRNARLPPSKNTTGTDDSTYYEHMAQQSFNNVDTRTQEDSSTDSVVYAHKQVADTYRFGDHFRCNTTADIIRRLQPTISPSSNKTSRFRSRHERIIDDHNEMYPYRESDAQIPLLLVTPSPPLLTDSEES